MGADSGGRDRTLEELREIRSVLETLLIVECARSGMTRAEIRAVVAVDNNRISRIARHVKPVENAAAED